MAQKSPKMPEKQIIISGPKRGRPALSEAERLQRAKKRAAKAELNPLALVSDTLKAALWRIAEGDTLEQAAEAAGMAVSSLKVRIYEPEGKAALRAIREAHRDGYRDKLWKNILGAAGVLPNQPRVEDDALWMKANLEALGMLGDSGKATITRMRFGDATNGEPTRDSEDDQPQLPVMPQLVINITSSGATSDGVTIEHGDE